MADSKGTLIPRAKLEGRHVLRPKAEGFTLLEVLVVIGIIELIAALGLFISFDVYRGFLHRSERDTIVSLLERARSHAMANIGESAWGFCATGGNYLVFSGASYTPSVPVDVSVAAGGASTITGMPVCGTNEVVFAQLSGTTTALTQPITITQGAAPADTITINDHGTIIW